MLISGQLFAKPVEKVKEERVLTLVRWQQLSKPAKPRVTSSRGIGDLVRMIKATPDSDPKKAVYLFALAKFNLERAEEASRERMSALGHSRAQIKKERRRASLRALKLYLQIALSPRYRSFDKRDEALYQSARLLLETRGLKKSRVFFKRLLTEHPKSRRVAWAMIVLGDHYFATKRFSNAAKFFERARAFGASPGGYAEYMKGWCAIRLQQPRKALEAFVRTIGGAPRWPLSPPQRSRLIAAAREGAVVAYADVGRPDKASAFFRRIGGDDARAMLGRLLAIYQRKGRQSAAAAVQQQLPALAP